MTVLENIRFLLDQAAQKAPSAKVIFYKTGPGEYAEQDRFKGVSMPILRIIAKEYHQLSRSDLQDLLLSYFNEERLLALLILIEQYQKNTTDIQESIYQFYLKNLSSINNWNLVDASAPYIIGAHLFDRDKTILLTLAKSEEMWKRRIAIVATWFFIRRQHYEWTLKIAKILLKDKQDLIHKSVGWMLREVGKQNQKVLFSFLNEHAPKMPRTMLRYAIEKLSPEQQLSYRQAKKT